MTTATKDELEKIGAIIEKARIGVLTTSTEDGRLVSRPLATVHNEFDGDVWFYTYDPSHKVHEIRHDAQVNVSYESGKGYLSLSGRASIVHDRAKIEEFWNPAIEAWFENGEDDPKVALIKVAAESAEYWANLDSKPVALLKYAKARATHSTPDLGENRTVAL
jgi:general stress protein 26